MRAKPTIAIAVPGKNHGGAAGARERLAIGMIPGARPRRDHHRHPTIEGRQDLRLLKHETEVGGLRPDIVPLRRHPLVEPGDDVVVRAEGKYVRMEQRPRRGVVDLADEASEGFKPVAEEARDFRVRDRQGVHGVLRVRAPDAAQREVLRC